MNGFQFTTLESSEPVRQRKIVEEFAENLYIDQRQTWWDLKKANKPCKPRWATREECFEKSRHIAIKRERDSSYWNDLVSERPIH